MRLASMFMVAASVAIPASIACGSNTVDPVSAPQCLGATGATGPGSNACNSCLQNKCGSDITPASNACGAYFHCYSSCKCLDSACLDGCASKIDTACTLGGAALLTCEMNSCASQCKTATPAANSPSDGGVKD